MGTDKTRLTRRARNQVSSKTIGLKPAPEHAQELGALFLGPHGENLDEMRALLIEVLDDHAAARRAFAPDDPPFLSDAVRSSEAFADTIKQTRANLKELSRSLISSTPMSSYRNQSHMNWDITMPGALGYFAAMMFNPNNVAPEASPVTTTLEIEAGNDLCRMLGYGATGTPEPWGHITCDGSIANAEALWAARNLRYQGAALARAIRLESTLADARTISVETGQGQTARLLDLEPWELVNLPNQVLLDLPQRLVNETGVKDADVAAALKAYGVQHLGLARLQSEVLMGLDPGRVLVPGTAHYSWDKAAMILGLGGQALHHIAIDEDARMWLPSLRAALDECLEAKIPVIEVVAVIGSTGESAVDPLEKILQLRAEYQGKGLSFTLHADAAWGGYFTSMLRPPPGRDGYTPIEPVSAYAKAQLGVLPQADTITIDPHKSGYLPYPAGSLCYRDKRMIYLVAHAAPVVFHNPSAPSVGVYGMEGSKPGAAAAGVAMSHHALPLDQTGYGALLGRCIFNAKRFYVGVNTLAEQGDDFFTISVSRLPAERRGATPEEIAEERALMKSELRNISNKELERRLEKHDELGRLFKDIGPDLTVLSYAFNLIGADGAPNSDAALMNDLNEAIFDRLSVEEVVKKDAPPDVPMLVTSSLIDPEIAGELFFHEFCRRAGVTPPNGPVRVLISTMQDPWVTDTSTGNFLPELMKILRATVLDARDALKV